MADQWYVGKGGENHGPFTNAQLKALADAKKLDPTDMLSKHGTGGWLPASSEEWLFASDAFTGTSPRPEEPPPRPAPTAMPVETKAIGQPVYADVGQRFVAAAADHVVSIILALAALFVYQVFDSPLFGFKDTQQPPGPFLLLGLALFPGFIYRTLMEAGERGATLGKLAMSIRVTDVDGRPIGIGRSLVRQIIRPLSFFMFAGFLLSLMTKRTQTLHDLVAGTVVVKT